MSALIIDGKKLANEFNSDTLRRAQSFSSKYGRKPILTLIQVGDIEDSTRYLNSKLKLALTLEIDAELISLEENINFIDLKSKLLEISTYSDGILVQFPLPPHLDQDQVISLIPSLKEIDGIHPDHISRLSKLITPNEILPCTPQGVIELVKVARKDLGFTENLQDLKVVVCGRSKLVGGPTALLFKREKAHVFVCHSKTSQEERLEMLANADIVVVAVGKALFLKASEVKKSAIVIDVGINYDSLGKICGDVDFFNVSKKVSAITPVPGGVGPMTLAMLMRNVIVSAENQQMVN